MLENKDVRVVVPGFGKTYSITDGDGKMIESGFTSMHDALIRADELIGLVRLGTPAEVYDNVKKPSHYNAGRYEVIDIIESILNTLKVEPFQAYCLGNSLKYIARAGLKGDFKEDIKKALMYLQWAIGEDPRNE